MDKKELIKFFESERVRNKGLILATYDTNGDSLTDLLWNDYKSMYLIFGAKKTSTIKKKHGEALMLQLIAAKIIILSVKKCNNDKLDLKWKFNRESVELDVVECTDECQSVVDEESVVANVETVADEMDSILCYDIDKYWTGIGLCKRKPR